MKFIKYLVVSVLALSFSQFASAVDDPKINVKFVGQTAGIDYYYMVENSDGVNEWSSPRDITAAEASVGTVTTGTDISKAIMIFNYKDRRNIRHGIDVTFFTPSNEVCQFVPGGENMYVKILSEHSHVTINVELFKIESDGRSNLLISCTDSR